jgi:hypothetical protein
MNMAVKHASGAGEKPGPVYNVEPSGWSEVRKPGEGIPQASEAEVAREKSNKEIEKADKVSQTAQDSNKETEDR